MSFIECNGHILHYDYLDNGSEETFLFINSLGTDFRIWEYVVKELDHRSNILLYDKRGHGLSDFSVAANGLTDYANDAACLIDMLSVKKCVAVGISVGGMIAQLLASDRPGQISKLILCDTAPRIGTAESWNDRIEQVKARGLKAISDGLMSRWFGSSFLVEHAAAVAGYKNMVQRCDPAGYIQACEAIRDADITGITKSLTIPALCLVGSEDPSTTPADVRRLSQLIPGSLFEIIPGSGHMPCIDNPKTFVKLITDFIKR